MDDHELLRQWLDQASDAAFTTLVERHVNLVYSVARRSLPSDHQAEEVTQTVFIILARKAGTLRPPVVLAGWLYRTTRYAAAQLLRSEMRREKRHETLLNMDTGPADSTWRDIAPHLEAALDQLNPVDRDAILLRFMEEKSLRDVGQVLGLSEDAAQKRVDRALDKMRALFARRGVATSAALLGSALAAHAVNAAPTGFAASVAIGAAAKTGATASTASLVKGTLKLMAWTKTKIAIASAAAVLLSGTAAVVMIEAGNKAKPGAAPLPGLIGAWSGEGDAADASGAHPGTIAGGVSFVPGAVGQAFQFNGRDALVNFGPDIGNFGTNDFSIACWIKTDSTNGQDALLEKRVSCDAASSFWEIHIGGGVNPPGITAVVLAPDGKKTVLVGGTFIPVSNSAAMTMPGGPVTRPVRLGVGANNVDLGAVALSSNGQVFTMRPGGLRVGTNNQPSAVVSDGNPPIIAVLPAPQFRVGPGTNLDVPGAQTRPLPPALPGGGIPGAVFTFVPSPAAPNPPVGFISFTVDNGGGEAPIGLSSTNAVNDGQWHHLVCVRNGVEHSLYLDGQLNNHTNTGGRIYNLNNAAPMMLGTATCAGINGTQLYPGAVDELQIYNRALGAEEIKQLHDRPGH